MNRYNWASNALFITAAVVLTALVIYLVSLGVGGIILPMAVLISAFLAACFFGMKFLCAGKLHKNIALMKTALDSALADPAAEVTKVVSDGKDMLRFNEELEGFKAKLRENEADRSAILNIINSVAINVEFDKLLDDLLPKLLDVTNSICCAFYMTNPATNKLELKRSLGFGKNIFSEFDVSVGEGFVGAAAAKRQVMVYNDIPDDSIYLIRTFLGIMKPKALLVMPIANQEQLMGMMVFAGLYDYTPERLSTVEAIKYYVGIAVNNGMAFERNKRLTSELKFQNKLIQDLNDELEKNVQERTVFLNKIIDSIKDYAIYAMDRDGCILLWNRGAELLLGHKPEDVIGKPVETIYSSESSEIGMVASRIDNALHNGRYAENGWRYKADGTKYYYEMLMFAMYNDKGSVIGLTNITRDITRTKRLESNLFIESEALRRVLANCPGVQLVVGGDGRIQAASQGANRMLAGDALKNIEGHDLNEFFTDLEVNYAGLATGQAEAAELRSVLELTGEPVAIHIDAMPGEDEGENRKLLISLDA